MPEKKRGTIGNFPDDFDKGKSDHQSQQAQERVEAVDDVRAEHDDKTQHPSQQKRPAAAGLS